MSQTEHISQDDLAQLAMQLLPEKDMPAALAHIAACADCRGELGRLHGDLAAYAMTADMHSPPAYARERLLRKIGSGVQFTVAKPSNEEFGFSQPMISHKKTPVSAFKPWAGWAIAAVMALFALLQFFERRSAESLNAKFQTEQAKAERAQDVLATMTDARAMKVGIHMASATEGVKHPPEAHAAYMADKGALVFFASNLAPLQPYKTYELWLLPSSGREPIAAGVFKPDSSGSANVLMPEIPKGVSAAGFGVTIEDEGGAKQPTPPILMSGS